MTLKKYEADFAIATSFADLAQTVRLFSEQGFMIVGVSPKHGTSDYIIVAQKEVSPND